MPETQTSDFMVWGKDPKRFATDKHETKDALQHNHEWIMRNDCWTIIETNVMISRNWVLPGYCYNTIVY